MIVLLNDSKIVYESFESQDELTNRIVYFIQVGHLDLIIFKGQPSDIDGKQKRRFIIKEYKGDLVDLDRIKKYFDRKTQCRKHQWCMMYKNK